MLLHRDSVVFRALRAIAYPFGPWFPLWVERARVGSDVHNFYTVTFRRPA